MLPFSRRTSGLGNSAVDILLLFSYRWLLYFTGPGVVARSRAVGLRLIKLRYKK